jgi:cbb3-type cytochrome oxidase maturation protein
MMGHSEGFFLLLWVGFLILGIGSAFAFIWWGVRNGQFSNQDRARYLPLQEENEKNAEPAHNNDDKEMNHDEQ